MNTKKGFTLIELLVVIAVIGLLSAIVLASLADARTKAQIAKFDAELLQVRTALQLYKLDNNGAYPAPMATFDFLPTITVLYNGGYYPRDSFSIPDFIYGIQPYGDYEMSCGKFVPDYEYALYVNVAPEYTGSLPPMYFEGFIVGGEHRCIEV